MNWIEDGKFSLSNSPSGRRYVYRKKTNGVKLEINVPSSVATKAQAQNWLRTHYKSPVVPAGRKKVRVPLINLSRVSLPVSYGNLGSPSGFRVTTPYGSVNNNAPKYNCNIGQRLFHRVSKNYSIGFNQTGANNKTNSMTLVQIKNTMVRKGMAKLDTGKQGTVFLASFRRRAPHGSEFVIKVCPYDNTLKGRRQVAIIEDMIQNKLYKVVPVHIPKPIAPLIFCKNFVPEGELMAKSNFNKDKDYSKQSVMFSEYISNGPFPSYIKKIASSPRKRLNDRFMKSAIFQVLNSLYMIRSKYPGFRHNDLHLENVLVKPGKLGKPPIMVINDFGYSTLDNNVSNPLVSNGRYAESWGIGPKTSPEYDVHLFLNEMRKECIRYKSAATDGFAKTLAFLNEVIPMGYRENTNKHTVRMRLRYNTTYPGLLNLKQILKSSYFGGAAAMTPSPRKLSLSNINRKAFTNANLKHMNISPNSRNWALGLKSPKRKRSASLTSPGKNAVKTPSGRIKVKNPSSGRLVYPDYLKLKNLMNIASRLNVKTSGLMTKKNIAQAIFSKV